MYTLRVGSLAGNTNAQIERGTDCSLLPELAQPWLLAGMLVCEDRYEDV